MFSFNVFLEGHLSLNDSQATWPAPPAIELGAVANIFCSRGPAAGALVRRRGA
jgi:hypothetical protein